MKKVYLDYSATTPVWPEVKKAMEPYFSDEKFGNPSSLHQFGQSALKAIDLARETIQKIIGAENFEEIIFTSSATESNNLAIKGLVFSFLLKNQKPHIISSTIEHPSVLEILKDLEKFKWAEIDLISPEETGLVDLEKIKKKIKENTVLITLHYVNNETGTIQSISQLGKIIQEINSSRAEKIYLHTDASQAFLTENCKINFLNVDLMTLSPHKTYGPKGISVLYKKTGIPVYRLLSGAEQEFGLRPGTENVPLIVGSAKAFEIADKKRNKLVNHFRQIRDYLIASLKSSSINFELNTDLENSSPKILNLYFPEILANDLMILLDQKGIAISTGSACSARAVKPSYVIAEITRNSQRAQKSVRLSFGEETTIKEIDYLVKCLKEIFTH